MLEPDLGVSLKPATSRQVSDLGEYLRHAKISDELRPSADVFEADDQLIYWADLPRYPYERYRLDTKDSQVIVIERETDNRIWVATTVDMRVVNRNYFGRFKVGSSGYVLLGVRTGPMGADLMSNARYEYLINAASAGRDPGFYTHIPCLEVGEKYVDTEVGVRLFMQSLEPDAAVFDAVVCDLEGNPIPRRLKPLLAAWTWSND